MKTEEQQIAETKAMAYRVLGSLKGADCNLNEAVSALLAAATALIQEAYPAEHRLQALSGFLAPTIEEWAADRGPVQVTLQ